MSAELNTEKLLSVKVETLYPVEKAGPATYILVKTAHWSNGCC